MHDLCRGTPMRISEKGLSTSLKISLILIQKKLREYFFV